MKYIFLLFKIVSTLALIYFAVRNVDFTTTKSFLYSNQGVYIISVCVAIYLMQSALAGIRVKSLLSIFNYSISAFRGLCFLLLGNLFSQTMISFIGGDAMRIVSLTRSGVSSDAAFKSILLDRVLGFIGIQMLFLTAMPFIFPMIPQGIIQWTLISLALISIVMIAGFIVLGYIPEIKSKNRFLEKAFDFIRISRYLIKSKKYFIEILLLSCFLHFCNILAIYFCTNALGSEISLFYSFIVGSPVMLLSLLPISVNGWGVRESSMIIGFGFVGIDSGIALTVSVFIGLASLIGSLPGIFVLLAKDKTIKLDEDVTIANKMI